MPLRWHVDLPGPLAYSRPVRRKHKHGLMSLVIWFTVKPLELIAKGVVAGLRSGSKPKVQPFTPMTKAPIKGHFAPVDPGWYETAYGPLYWNGLRWFWPDGRAAF